MSSVVADKVRDFFKVYPYYQYGKSEVIIQAERAPAGIFYLVEGRVNQYDIAPNGAQLVVNVYKPGAFFPMSWALNETSNRYFFEMAADGAVRLAPAGAVLEFLHAHPDILEDLLSRVYRGLDGVLARMVRLMGGTAQDRVLFELLNTVYRFGDGQLQNIQLPLHEQDLAKQSGLARETVSRLLSSLKAEGIAYLTGVGIVVVDIKKLERALQS